jgi:hypothetical protein
MPNAKLTACIYDRLMNELTLPHSQLRQHAAELAASVVTDSTTWPIVDGDLAVQDRLINPQAYDAASSVCFAFDRYDKARTRSEAASALVDLTDAISDLTSFLSPEDREALDYGGEDPKDRAREIARRAARRDAEGNDTEAAG